MFNAGNKAAETNRKKKRGNLALSTLFSVECYVLTFDFTLVTCQVLHAV